MPSPAGIPPASPSGIGATSDVRCVGGGVGDTAAPAAAGNKVDTPAVMAAGNAEKNNARTSTIVHQFGMLKLPPPANDGKYTNIEVIDLVITHNASDVVKAIHASAYRPKKAALYRMLSKNKPFDKDTLVLLLNDGTKEWNERVTQITKYTGQSERQIRRIIGLSKEYDSDEEDEEVTALCSNQSINNGTPSSTSLTSSTPSTISTSPSSTSLTPSTTSTTSTSPASAKSTPHSYGSLSCTPSQMRSQ